VNYRHAFHAGNFADVVKHAVLALAVERLKRKDTPFRVLDTHAGIGLYDLGSDEARRTGEHLGGVARVLAAAEAMPAALRPYLDAVRAADPSGAGRAYPGSPEIVRSLMRPQDRLVLAELHPEDAATLKARYAGDPRIAVHRMDGWLAVKAHLPPPERRGIALVDPPFEEQADWDRLPAALSRGARRFPQGTYLLWHPIKERAAVWRLHEACAASGARDVHAVEATVRAEDTHLRLNGCGLVVANPPWGLLDDLAAVLPALHAAFGTGEGGTRIAELVPE
jgi:23S rRNA (adenine2030-N6)-methyltransferase